jgi:flavodoxin
MKTAIVYYSYEGNCARIAELLRAEFNADLIALQTVDGKVRKGLAKYAWGGAQVFMKKLPALKPCQFEPAAYDLIILGAPVWAGSPAPPLQSFLTQTKISGKRAALYCCHLGGIGKALEKMRVLLPGNTIAGSIDFINPSAGNEQEIKRKIAEWAQTLRA